MQVFADIPDEMVPAILEMFQANYPTLVVGLSPTHQVQAVMTYWVRTMMINYATDKARQAGDQAVAQAEAAKAAAIEAARQKMDDATKFLMDVTSPDPVVPDVPPADPTPVDPAPTTDPATDPTPTTDAPVVGG